MPIVLVYCTFCKEPHPDHYECSKCGTYLGGLYKPASDQAPGHHELLWMYCPYCGSELNREELHIEEFGNA